MGQVCAMAIYIGSSGVLFAARQSSMNPMIRATWKKSDATQYHTLTSAHQT